jgi:hypothetical protein
MNEQTNVNLEALKSRFISILFNESSYAYQCGLENSPGPLTREEAENLIQEAIEGAQQ